MRELDDDLWEEEDEEILDLFEKENEEYERSTAPPPNLAQMERDCERWSRELDALLAADPDIPSEILVARMRQIVRPLSEYRPTEEEMLALRLADIKHTLRGEKDHEQRDADPSGDADGPDGGSEENGKRSDSGGVQDTSE